jgi:ElaB/YqjD/DUF883 family membrane-anchored ribosome-binding protein
MADNDSDLPEGTDKIIAGASRPTNTGAIGVTPGASGGGSEGELLIEADADVAALAAAAPTSGAAPIDPGVSLGAGGGGDLSGSGTGATGTSGNRVISRLKDGGKDLSGQAAGKARDLVGQGLERGAEALANVSRMIGDTATGLDERLGEEYGDYARRAASALEGTANSLAGKDADELIDDTRDFVRKSPGVALAGAAIVGFALARLIKTGLTGDERSRSDRSES